MRIHNGNANRKLSVRFLFAVVPLALLAISGYLANARGPYSLSQNFDPEYGYLLSSVSILGLHVPTFTDNPGTTVEEIGAAVGLEKGILGRIAGSRESISLTILKQLEEYLRAIQVVLAALVAGAVFWAGWTMFQFSGSLTASLVLQLSVFLFRETLVAVARVSPEPLLLAVAFGMSAVLLQVILPAMQGAAPGLPEELWSARWAGALWGFGIATKFTFIPVGAVVFVFGAKKARTRFLTSGVLAGLLFTLPIWPIIYRPALWLLGVLTHRGYYGEGERGLPTVSQILENLWMFVRMEPGFFGLLFLYAIVLLYVVVRPKASNDWVTPAVQRLLWTGSVCVALQFAAMLKQYRAHYMIPAFGLMALVNGFTVLFLLRREWTPRQRTILACTGAILLAAGVAQGSWKAYLWGQVGSSEKRDAAELAQFASTMRDCVVIGYYRSSVPGFGLGWGSEYAEGASAGAMNEILPNAIVYNRFQPKFISAAPEPRGNEVQRMLRQGRCVLMQGTPVTEELLVLPPGYSITPIAERKNEGLYRLAWTPPTEGQSSR